jgi:hypothetical protein
MAGMDESPVLFTLFLCACEFNIYFTESKGIIFRPNFLQKLSPGNPYTY